MIYPITTALRFETRRAVNVMNPITMATESRRSSMAPLCMTMAIQTADVETTSTVCAAIEK
jgi:hypothetical protein